MQNPDKIRCDACPVMCFIAPGQTGACDRYANDGGRIVRCDPVTILSRTLDQGGRVVPFAGPGWDGEVIRPADAFVTGIGAGTTYPDYKPAPFIVSSGVEGADMVTVETEAIFSYCAVKVRMDTDRFLGPEGAAVRAADEPVGHVTTAEYSCQILSLGGVHYLTGSKAVGRATCAALLALSNGEASELTIDGGSTVVVQAGRAPVADSRQERRMRVGCGSAKPRLSLPSHPLSRSICVSDFRLRKLIAALGGREGIDAYGKGAIVGAAGEAEHGALWHVPGGYAMRELLGESRAIVPSAMKLGAMGRRSTCPWTISTPSMSAAISTRSPFRCRTARTLRDPVRAGEGRRRAGTFADGGLEAWQVCGEDGLR